MRASFRTLLTCVGGILTFSFAAPALAGVSVAQLATGSATTSGSSVTLATTAADCPAGSTLVVAAAIETNNLTVKPTGVSDGFGNAYAASTLFRDPGINFEGVFFYANVTTDVPAGTSLVVTYGGVSNSGREAAAVCVAGLVAPLDLNSSTYAVSSGTTPSVTAASPTNYDSEIVFGIDLVYSGGADAFTQDASYTTNAPALISTRGALRWGYRVVDMTGTWTYAPTLGRARTNIASYITFVATCPQGLASAAADGCKAANANGAFTVKSYYGTDFATHAQQSTQYGQQWLTPHPWAWNAPGADYPVGYDTTLQLLDPAIVSATTDANATLTQSGCGGTAWCFYAGPVTSTSGSPLAPWCKVATNGTYCGQFAVSQILTWAGNSGTSVTILSQVDAAHWIVTAPPGGAPVGNKPITATWPSAIGCTFDPADTGVFSSPNAGVAVPRVFCVGAPPSTGLYANTYTFNGFDFSLHGCTQVRAGYGGPPSNYKQNTLVIHNSKFVDGVNCNYPAGAMVTVITQSTTGLDFQYNLCDGGWPALPEAADHHCVNDGGDGLDLASRKITNTVQYNAFLNLNQDIGSFQGANADIHVRYNYADSFDMGSTVSDHGAWFITSPPQWGSVFYPFSGPYPTVDLLDYSYNVSVIAAQTPHNSGSTTFSILGAQGWFAHYNASNVSNNVAVANLHDGGAGDPGDGQAVTATALMFYNSVMVDQAVVANNFTDPTGALECVQTLGNGAPVYGFIDDGLGLAANFSGFVDDGLSTGCGSAPCFDGQAGNVLTVTGVSSGAFDPAAAQYVFEYSPHGNGSSAAGLTLANTFVTGAGAGNGGAPTYLLNQSQTQATTTSAAPGTYDPATGIVTLTLSSALNLPAGVPITVSTANGTGSYASIIGSFTTGAGTGANVVTFTIAPGLTMTIASASVVTKGLAPGQMTNAWAIQHSAGQGAVLTVTGLDYGALYQGSHFGAGSGGTDFGQIQPYGTSGTTGQGGTGTYALPAPNNAIKMDRALPAWETTTSALDNGGLGTFVNNVNLRDGSLITQGVIPPGAVQWQSGTCNGKARN